MITIPKFPALLAALLTALLPPGFAAATSLPPATAGAYPVACSNVAQDFAAAPNDDARNAVWTASPSSYVTDLLSEKDGALQFTVQVPVRVGLFPSLSGRSIPHVALVCYPTSQNNPRPDYPITQAGKRAVPKMQRGKEAPLWADANAQYPLLVYAHGLGGSPLTEGYLETMLLFASHGYVVASTFHGDPRFADVRYDGLADAYRLLFNGGFEELLEMQAIRPHALQGLLNLVLSNPDYASHIDSGRIAGFGISLGAESLLLLAGADVTDRLFPLRGTKVLKDRRLRAAATFVPYFGQRLAPAFADDNSGLQSIAIPFLGIAGTADSTAPIAMVSQGFDQMAGSRYLVSVEGLEHKLPPDYVPDIMAWSLAFYRAALYGDLATTMGGLKEVSGGAPDTLTVNHTAPGAAPARDTALFSGKRADFTIRRSATGYSVTDNVSVEGTQAFTAGTTRLRFADKWLAMDIDGTAGQVYRLYQAAFDRAPDTAGFGYQIAAMELGGRGLIPLAQNFLDSPEFASRHGMLDDSQFVTLLYQNVLHRAPEPEGFAFYLDGLANARFSRAQVLAGVSDSPENKALVLPAILEGMEYTPLGP